MYGRHMYGRHDPGAAFSGISTGPPGDVAVLAVSTSTPVSVTRSVCSTTSQHSSSTYLCQGLTKLRSALPVNSRVRPLVRPVYLLRLPECQDRLDREGHAGLACAHGFVLCVVRDPWRGMELSIKLAIWLYPHGLLVHSPRC